MSEMNRQSEPERISWPEMAIIALIIACAIVVICTQSGCCPFRRTIYTEEMRHVVTRTDEGEPETPRIVLPLPGK